MTTMRKLHNFLLISLIGIVLQSCDKQKVEQKTTTPESRVETRTPPTPSISYPSDELSFHSMNLTFKERLDDAKNDLQRSAVVNECDKARTKFFKEKKSRLDNWIGKVSDISSESTGGWAFISIVSEAAGFPISYQTHYQRWSTWGEESVLNKGTKIYNQAAQLSVGETVTFSGKFIASLYYKYTEDNSIDVESVQSPKIILKFDNITLLHSESKE